MKKLNSYTSGRDCFWAFVWLALFQVGVFLLVVVLD